MPTRTVMIPMTGEPTPKSHWRIIGEQGLYRQAMPERMVQRFDSLRLERGGLIQQSHQRTYDALNRAFDDGERIDICNALGVEPDFFPLNTGRSWGYPQEPNARHHQPISTTLKDDGRLLAFTGHRPVDDGAEIEEDAELEGWLMCHPGPSPTRETIKRCMRITIIINLWQRYHDERTSIEWFKAIQANEGMPVMVPDEPDDRMWQALQSPIDPLTMLSLYELQRLYAFTIYAHELDDVVAKNVHNDLMLSRVLPMRVVRFGRYPSPFALCQPIGLTDLDTQALSPYLIRHTLAGIGAAHRHGIFYLTNAIGTGLTDGIWDLRRTSDTKQLVITNLSVFNDPEVADYVAVAEIPAKTAWNGDDYIFSSLYDSTAHLDAQAVCWGMHDSLFTMTEEIEDGADPEGFIATWKDNRPLKIVDYAKPRHPHWSDLLKCRKCNQRVQVLLPSGNTLAYVQCPTCKDEQGVATDHLMNGWKPASVALSVRKGQGETMMEE